VCEGVLVESDQPLRYREFWSFRALRSSCATKKHVEKSQTLFNASSESTIGLAFRVPFITFCVLLQLSVTPDRRFALSLSSLWVTIHTHSSFPFPFAQRDMSGRRILVDNESAGHGAASRPLSLSERFGQIQSILIELIDSSMCSWSSCTCLKQVPRSLPLVSLPSSMPCHLLRTLAPTLRICNVAIRTIDRPPWTLVAKVHNALYYISIWLFDLLFEIWVL
jgi:hypothetical protein